MADSNLSSEINRRRTFAIISHPDAGKTTITEKLLLLGNAIAIAGSVKGKKGPHATSDWMSMEQERGISVTSSVMQFPYRERVVNLLDTPGHEDFSEDTYRTLTAVDSALMVIDGAKGVEDRTIKLMNVTRLRDTPILSFVNKMDRPIRDPIDLLDEIEEVLDIPAAPINWPIGMGDEFRGVYNLYTDTIHCFKKGNNAVLPPDERIEGLASDEARALLGEEYDDFAEEIELVRGASHEFELEPFLAGRLTPVFFGTALGNFGVREMLDDFVEWAPPPQGRDTRDRHVEAAEPAFSGFVFKIQANMDPRHRDRIAFLRVCSGRYGKGMKMRHVRLGKEVKIADAVTFKAGERVLVEEAMAGDIIGPMKSKQLQKGLQQLSEEGSTQVFAPISSTDLIVGAVGQLQFDVVAYRLKDEYKVEAIYEPVNVYTARWVYCDDERKLEDFRKKAADQLSIDGGGYLSYLAPTRVNLSLMEERWPDIKFRATREH